LCVLTARHDSGGILGSVSTSVPVDQETVDTDEGIGESETDVASSTDADASCPSVVSSNYQHPSSVTSSPSTQKHCQQHNVQMCELKPDSAHRISPDVDQTQRTLMNASVGDQNCLVDATKLDSEDCETSQTFNIPGSAASVDDQGCVEDAVELALSEDSGSSQTYDVLKSVSRSDDDPALSEDSGSSQTLSVTQSGSLNDDDQGSLTDVTETAHSEDSGSSRTVEVGDDDVPQLLDDDEVDAEGSLPIDPLSPVEHDYPPVSTLSTDTSAGGTPWTGNETAECGKDVTLTKESGENWDDEPLMDLRADDDNEVTCKYNYCFVQKSAFPLGYERSKCLRLFLSLPLWSPLLLAICSDYQSSSYLS